MICCSFFVLFHVVVSFIQEDANRGKPNWEHLSDELHVLITVEDTENRAHMKLERAVEEVKKLLVPVSTNTHCCRNGHMKCSVSYSFLLPILYRNLKACFVTSTKVLALIEITLVNV